MRPHLIDFNNDGSIFIDPAFFSLPPIKQMVEYKNEYGRPWIEVLIRLYHYRSPVNPYLPMDERVKIALAYTRRKYPHMKGTEVFLNHPLWQAAVDCFKENTYDPLYDRYFGLERKIAEFQKAINETPVIEACETPPARGKKKASKKASMDEDDDDEEEEEKVQKYYINNTKILDDMRKALTGFVKDYEDCRRELLQVRKDKATSGVTSVDYKKEYQD